MGKYTVPTRNLSTAQARLVDAFQRSPGLRKISANVGWLSLDRGLRIVNGLFIGAWMARYLGPADFGLLNYCFAFVALFAPLLKLGVERFVVHDLVDSPDHRDTTLGTGALLLFVGSMSALALASLLITFLRPDDWTMRHMVVVRSLIGLFQVSLIIDFWFQSQVASKWSVMATALGTMLNAGLRVALICWKAPVIWFVYVGVTESALVAVVLVWCYAQRTGSPLHWKLDLGRAKEMLRKSWPFILSGAAGAIYMKIDQVMLGSFRSDTELGRYSVAVRITELTYFVPAVLASSIFPALVKLKNSKQVGLYDHRLQQFFDLHALAALLCVFLISMGGSVFVTGLFGSAYSASIPLLLTLVWATVPTFLGVARSQYLVNHSLARYQLLGSGIGLVTNVSLNLVLIPWFGGIGAAVATVISQTVVCIGVSLMFPRLRAIGYMQLKSIFVFFRLRTLMALRSDSA